MFDNTNYNERNMKDINTKHKAEKNHSYLILNKNVKSWSAVMSYSLTITVFSPKATSSM